MYVLCGVIVPARQAENRFLGSIKGLRIRLWPDGTFQDFKNVNLILVHPKQILANKFYNLKSPRKNGFLGNTLLGSLACKVKRTKNVHIKAGFFDTPFDLHKEYKFSSRN
jgi:hypothetical protein